MKLTFAIFQGNVSSRLPPAATLPHWFVVTFHLMVRVWAAACPHDAKIFAQGKMPSQSTMERVMFMVFCADRWPWGSDLLFHIPKFTFTFKHFNTPITSVLLFRTGVFLWVFCWFIANRCEFPAEAGGLLHKLGIGIKSQHLGYSSPCFTKARLRKVEYVMS